MRSCQKTHLKYYERVFFTSEFKKKGLKLIKYQFLEENEILKFRIFLFRLWLVSRYKEYGARQMCSR